jgi:hypothetical protein
MISKLHATSYQMLELLAYFHTFVPEYTSDSIDTAAQAFAYRWLFGFDPLSAKNRMYK